TNAKPRAPRIMALVPFIQDDARRALLPAFVISPPLTDETPPDLLAYAASIDGPFRHAADVEVLATAVADGKTEALLAASAGTDVADRLRKAGVKARGLTPVGGFARGIAVKGASTLLYRAVERAGERV